MENNIQENSAARRGRNGVKLLVICGLCILLLIPWLFIRDMIAERGNTESAAEQEVYDKWGGPQLVTGPCIKVYTDKSETSYSLMPEVLDITAEATTRTLSRGIYDFTVYDADVVLRGSFALPPTLSEAQRQRLARNVWRMSVNLSSLKGLTDNPTVRVGGHVVPTAALTFEGSRLLWAVDVQPLLAGGTIEYEIHLPLRGANSLDFIPMGNTTTVRMHSDCATPSFGGSFLPTERDVRSDGFDAEWRVLAINRSFPQVLSKDSWHMVDDNTVGVELRRPVEQYQQNERAVKYAFLIVLLTFAVVFFVEVRRDQPIHPVQYMLIGIAVMLFYTLLLSFSEHLSFLVAYLIASAMTATMLGCYLGSIMKTWRVGMLIGGMLAVLYAFIYVLLQIESYALLVGSVGLFAVLAVAMAASRKINWYR